MSIKSSLNDCLKDFRKMKRSPGNDGILSINVYNQRTIKKSDELGKGNSFSATNQSLEIVCRTSFDCAGGKVQKKTFKLNLTKKTPERIEVKKSENPVFAVKNANMSNLGKVMERESILFNQVKNLSNLKRVKPRENENQAKSILFQTDFINYVQFKTQKSRRLSVNNSIKHEINTEVISGDVGKIEKNYSKRKQLKKRVWKWVGAEGEIIY